MKVGELWRESLAGSRAWWRELRDRFRPSPESRPGRGDFTKAAVAARPCLPDCQGAYARLKGLPDAFRELFENRPLEGESPLFAGRDNALADLRDAVSAWEASPSGAIALVGPDGAGRTTLLNRLVSGFTGRDRVTRVTLAHRVRTETDLIQTLLLSLDMAETVSTVEEMAPLFRRGERRIILVDNAQRLLLRTPDALPTSEAFVSLVAATQADCLWVVSFKEGAWRRLDYILGARAHFSTVLELPYFNREEFSAVMEKRLAAAAVPMVFHAPRRHEKKEALSHGTDKTDRHPAPDATSFVEHLFTLSGGNMPAALYYWHAFSVPDPSLKEVVLHAGEGIDFSLLKELDSPSRFALAELMAHGCLTAGEHSEIFQQDERMSRLQLDALHRLRLLNKSAPKADDREAIYRIEPIFCAPVSAFLEAAHLMY